MNNRNRYSIEKHLKTITIYISVYYCLVHSIIFVYIFRIYILTETHKYDLTIRHFYFREAKVAFSETMFQKGKMFSLQEGDFQVDADTDTVGRVRGEAKYLLPWAGEKLRVVRLPRIISQFKIPRAKAKKAQ